MILLILQTHYKEWNPAILWHPLPFTVSALQMTEVLLFTSSYESIIRQFSICLETLKLRKSCPLNTLSILQIWLQELCNLRCLGIDWRWSITHKGNLGVDNAFFYIFTILDNKWPSIPQIYISCMKVTPHNSCVIGMCLSAFIEIVEISVFYKTIANDIQIRPLFTGISIFKLSHIQGLEITCLI